jgi:cytochrome oxidase Cu insertion factor (SCO1/SenC/PrrC family)
MAVDLSSRAALTAYIGLKEIASAVAPAIALVDQTGRVWDLSGQRGHIVLVTFFSKGCSDICPVLGTEIRMALADLAGSPARVDVAIVNTDPRDLSRSADPAALAVPGLAGRANVQFLTGSLRSLNSVWTSYGVRIRVGETRAQIQHNDVLYFVDARGRLRALASPFARPGSSPASLSRGQEQRFARGLADEASSLVR